MAELAGCDEPLFPHFMIAPGGEGKSKRAGAALGALSASRCTLEIDSAIGVLIEAAFPRRAQANEKRRAHGRKLARVREYLDQHYGEDIALEDLAQLVGLHRRHLIGAFKDFAGITPHAYLTARRVNAACEAIRNGAPLAQAAASSGFYDQSHLHRHFKRMMGLTPDALARAYQR
jgi:AraC-like DNA-binding protein